MPEIPPEMVYYVWATLLVLCCAGSWCLTFFTLPGNWLMVETVDADGLSPVLNAKVRVVAGEQRWLREVRPHQSYLTTSDPRVHFGLGDVERIDRVLVRWPDGSEDVWEDIAPNQVIAFTYGSGRRP